MNKTLIYAAFTLANTVLFSPKYAIASNNNGKIPHIDGNVQFPPTRSEIVRHTFRIHVPLNSKAVTQLVINAPDTVTLSQNLKKVDVMNENEQKINAKISIINRTILIVFSEPIAPNTKLEVDLNNVKLSTNLGNGPVYRLGAKVVGTDADISIGVAWFHRY